MDLLDAISGCAEAVDLLIDVAHLLGRLGRAAARRFA